MTLPHSAVARAVHGATPSLLVDIRAHRAGGGEIYSRCR
jgi:hypothetical protein